MDKKLNIVETAETRGKFNIFIKALALAELSETFKGEGPFTVFAPTDAAFAKLSEITLSNFFQPQNVEKLRALLKYHVISGKLTTAEMEKSETVTPTLQGQTVKIDGSHGVRINFVSVQTADIEASNGVVHVINNVLMPSKAAGNMR